MTLRISKVYLTFLLAPLFLENAFGLCDVTHCTDSTKCLFAPDKRRCKCAVGYYGDLCDEVATINVMCGKDYITIMVVEDFFKYYNIKLEDLHLGNKSCRAQQETVAGVSYYMARTTKDRYLYCGGKALEKNFTHIAYSQTLQSDPVVKGNIIRDPLIKIEYKCVYPYIRTLSLPFPIVPISSETVMRVNEMEATIVMSLFKDGTYMEAFDTSPQLQLKEKAYVEARVVEPEDYFHLRVNECWSTQSAMPNDTDGLSHTLLLNGCVKDETVKFHGWTAEHDGVNGNGSVVRYSFDVFRFTTLPHEFYLHCTIQLCSLGDESCLPDCKLITKREVSTGDPKQGLLSYGPIRFKAPDRHSNVLLILGLSIGGIWVLGIFILILMAVARAGNRRLSRLSNL
ncbi:zona pellucida glycoprotein d isoform X1 [Paramormyrops kingsleyae]|uniref:zona pellucida glycoprotein d isoform X1 n=2 Tax=Paramormyrops kingsleyae TaxID=1676925 RepID=UPI003B97181E